MALDFTRATDLFMGNENELALALGITVADLRELRTNPRRVSAELLTRLGQVLMERGKGMTRVGELLSDA
ncbi:MAG: hypothetical protein ACRENP_14645 [Longimicrobiales bacterium]